MRPPLLAAALAAVLPLALAAQSQAPPAAEAVRLDFTEETLPNGLRVVLHVDRSTPLVSTMLWYDVGSKHEQPGRTGFAHLFEHLMLFTGSRNVPEGQHFAMLEAAGGRAGADINGTTSNDRTNYFQQVPSHMLELALWLEADRMATLDEALNEGKLDNQREVVKNERRQGIDNQPYGRWMERMLAHAYPEGHPYRHPVVGSLEDLENARLEEVKEFFRTHYVPNNAVLVVAGDIDVEATRALVRRYFGPIPRGQEPPPVRDAALPPRIGAPAREVIEDANAPAPAVYLGFRVPADPRPPRRRGLGAGRLPGGRAHQPAQPAAGAGPAGGHQRVLLQLRAGGGRGPAGGGRRRQAGRRPGGPGARRSWRRWTRSRPGSTRPGCSGSRRRPASGW